jgi:hypothetical protein|tara:strand:- start:179 stop:358 length:180 start_codon:yes stop_codon:yes gene_type:complete
MKKIIDFFKKLFGIKKEEVKPVVVSKPKPNRKPRKKTSGGGSKPKSPKKPTKDLIKEVK